MFDKILIANRGEIAVRIIRTAKDLGFRTVAVFSEADKHAPHVTLADEAVCIGASNVTESYLVIDKLIAAAKATGANAIHPGYGFLSENADFARTCLEHKISFIGPSADAIELMGCKRKSKIAMLQAGVPCIPGYEGSDQSDETLIAEALNIGFPLMIKAAKGGGGRGMRLVEDELELKSAIKSARSEATNAFGSGELIIEKAISDARHIEIQIFADSLGNTIHLAERDCSVQRRHQKVIEEAPSMVLTDFSRKQMGDAAVLAAKSCNYVGAGTVEFLYDDSKSENNFYFLEMNTRLQVEHPVTELVTGLDLVEMQLNVANGEELPLKQEEVRITGHAMEVRLYAEDPANNFMPQTGKIHLWQPALSNSTATSFESQKVTKTRIDSGIKQGQTVSAFYDPMLAKLISFGNNRELSRRRLVKLVQDTQLLGVRDNRAFLSELLTDQNFVEGQAKINFIADEFKNSKSLMTQEVTSEDWLIAAALMKSQSNTFIESNSQQGVQTLHTSYVGQQLITLACEQSTDEPKKLLVSQPLAIENDSQKTLHITSLTGKNDTDNINSDCTEQIEIIDVSANKIRYSYQGVIKARSFVFDNNPEKQTLWLSSLAGNLQFFDNSFSSNKSEKVGSDQVTASMDGLVIDVLIKEGQQVKTGDVIAVIEAMKMEHLLKASVDGHVVKILTTVGDQVKARQLLVQLKQLS